jgi:hypothetical protein
MVFPFVPFADPGVHLIDRFLADRTGQNAKQVGLFLPVRPNISHVLYHRTHSFAVRFVHLTSKGHNMVFDIQCRRIGFWTGRSFYLSKNCSRKVNSFIPNDTLEGCCRLSSILVNFVPTNELKH